MGDRSPARRSWLIGAGLAVAVIAVAVIGLVRRVKPKLASPRCEVEPLERLGRELANDDPVERLDRSLEVVDALLTHCDAISEEMAVLIVSAIGAVEPDWRGRAQPRGSVLGSRRYGCFNGDGDDELQRCLERSGYPSALRNHHGARPWGPALWSQLMLEDVGVSRAAAQQITWVIDKGGRRRKDFEGVRSPLVERGSPLRPRERVMTVRVGDEPSDLLAESLIVDRNVTAAQLRELRAYETVAFHAYSIALGDAFPFEVWIPLRIRRNRGSLPLRDQPRALVVQWARAGPLVVRGVEAGVEAEEAELHVVVTDDTATWGELLATVMELAPSRCSTKCEDGWATLWLTTDDGATGFRKQVASVKHGVETVEGKLDEDIIRRIVRAHVNEIRSCYEAGLARDPSAGGSVTVEFTIAATGKVTSSEAPGSTEVDVEIVECITEAFTRWRFPKPSRGKVRVSYAVGLSVL